MKTGTPVPKRENELKSTGSGPVVTYTLPPEEIEKVRPTREKFLQLRAAGMAHAKIERELGIPQGSLSYWLRKWNLKGVTVEKARELLEQDATGAAEPSRSAEDAAPIHIAKWRKGSSRRRRWRSIWNPTRRLG